LNEVLTKIFDVLFLPLITDDFIFNEILKSIIIFSLENIKSSLKPILKLIDCIPSILKYLKFVKYQPQEILNGLKHLKTSKKILVIQKIVSEKDRIRKDQILN
jgi:hypothetical protein